MTGKFSWEEVRKSYPNRWVLFEATEAHSHNDKRVVDAISLIETFTNGEYAMRKYLELHKANRKRELYVVNTDREELDITEKRWLGMRMT